MKIRNSIFALTALVAIAGSTLMAAAQSDSALSLYQGTQLTGQLRRDLNTAKAEVGDHVMLDVVEPYPNNNIDFDGAMINAEVTSVTAAGQGRKPSIGLQFDYLELADGTRVNINATMTADQRVQQKKSGAHVLLDTIGGMLLGNAVGKTIFHTGGGGIAGAAGGFLYGSNQQADFDLPRGSDIQLTLNQPVTIRRQSSGQPPQVGMQQQNASQQQYGPPQQQQQQQYNPQPQQYNPQQQQQNNPQQQQYNPQPQQQNNPQQPQDNQAPQQQENPPTQQQQDNPPQQQPQDNQPQQQGTPPPSQEGTPSP